MRSLTVLLCLALIAVPRAAEKWTYASSAHFEVYATGGDSQARDALTHFERVHAFFTEFLKISPLQTKPTRLIVFSGDKQFAPYRLNEAAVAYYLPGPDRDFIVMKDLDVDAYPIVVHEYAHLIIRASGGKYPVWLNEGLAEFFSTMAPDGNDRMSIGRVPSDRLQYLNTSVALLPVDRLFAVTHDSPEYTTKAHAGLFYSESWALTHMLLTGEHYRPKSDEFLRLMANGASSDETLKTLYGKSPEAIGVELRNYVRQNQYVYFLVNYKSPAREARPQTRPADAFEAGLVTTNLLANSRDKESEARTAFEQLAAQKPNDLSLLESRASFELRRGHRTEALPYLARAVELGSTSPSVYRDYAALEPAKAAPLIARAFALSPGDLDIRLLYVSTLVSQRKSEEAVTTLNAVKHVPPESAYMTFQLLANAYMQLDRIAEARSAAARAVEFAQPGAEADYAARLSKSIEDFVAYRAATARSNSATTTPGAAALPAGTQAGSQTSPTSPSAGTLGAQSPRGPVVVVTGRLKNMICGSGAPILEVDTGTDTLRLLIDKPPAILVESEAGAITADLNCGAQDVPLRVGFIPSDDAARKTVGVVRRLDYRLNP
jgi:tetratricopeptide (TPR) repeat protein